MATANEQRLISCEIRQPRLGAWYADIEVDVSDDEAPAAFEPNDEGQLFVTIEHAGATFKGVAVRIGTQGAKLTARIAGGKGGLEKELTAKNYVTALGVKVGIILSDLMRESGEELSATVEQATLDRVLPRWSRASGLTKLALAALVEALGFTWRVLRDGTIWIGPITYPVAEPPHIVVGDDDNQTGCQTVASLDEDATGPLTLEPGTTFNGRRVEQVIHRLEQTRFRTEVYERTAGDALRAAAGSSKREIDYSRAYHATVTAMNADGTVQIKPDDSKISGGGLDKVRIWLGVPGSVTVPSGARCVLEFEHGNPQKPFVSRFGGSELTELKLGTGDQFVALANLVTTQLNDIRTELVSIGSTVSSISVWAAAHVHTSAAPGNPTTPPVTPPAFSYSPGWTPGNVGSSKVKASN